MKTQKITPDVEKKLLSMFGTNGKIAERLGITYRRYCQIRARDERLSRRISILVDLYLNHPINTKSPE